MATVTYSSGLIVPDAVIVIWDDLHNERAGYYRAFWAAGPDADTGSTVIGYCSPSGSHKTIKAVAAEIRRLHPDEPIYHKGRLI